MEAGKGKSRDFSLSQASPTRWSRRVFPQQPQVNESIDAKFSNLLVRPVYLLRGSRVRFALIS
jgi:hypothetical protein